jgi:hypothetical protein
VVELEDGVIIGVAESSWQATSASLPSAQSAIVLRPLLLLLLLLLLVLVLFTVGMLVLAVLSERGQGWWVGHS